MNYNNLTTVDEKDWLTFDEKENKMVIKSLSGWDRSYNGSSPTPKEKLNINPKVAVYKSEKDIVAEIPHEWISKNENIYGKLSNLSYTDPVRNLNWDFLEFKDSSVFQPAAIAFRKSKNSIKDGLSKPMYTHHLKGTKAYRDFWEEEFRRIKFGYEPVIDGKPCGLRISGEFYFYLNYSLIKKIVRSDLGVDEEKSDFPDFLAMDYYWFKELEARENPQYYDLPLEFKRSISCTKTRRAGFSYKAAAGCVWILAFQDGSPRVVIASAPDTHKTDAALAAQKCIPILDHLSNYTPFGVQDIGDPATNGGWKNEVASITNVHVQITLGSFNTRTKEKKGRQSTLITLSLSKDDAASGEGIRRLYIEEAGKVSNLKNVWAFARESMKAGAQFRGIAIIFGTGGSMITASGKEGSSRPFSDMHYNPVAEELADYDNIYEYDATSKNNKCGYFVSSMWCHFGAELFIEGKKIQALDSNGNARFWVADLVLNKERYDKQPPRGKLDSYNKYLTQKPKTASEAFLITQGSVFQTADLINLQNDIRLNLGGFERHRTPGELIESHGVVTFKPDFQNKLQPICNMADINANKEGCVLLYETPKKINGSVPSDAYLICADFIGINTSSGSSLISILVVKNPDYYKEISPLPIVATYHGRQSNDPLTFGREVLLKLSKYYNAKITYENDRDGGIFQDFKTRGELSRLLFKPVNVINKYISPNSSTLLREYGHPMSTDKHKSTGENITYEWLAEKFTSKSYVDDNDNIIASPREFRTLDFLRDELLIEQLILYKRDGNYDAVLALFGGTIQLKELYSLNENENKKHAEDLSSQIYDYYVKKMGTKSEKLEYMYNKNNNYNNV